MLKNLVNGLSRVALDRCPQARHAICADDVFKARAIGTSFELWSHAVFIAATARAVRSSSSTMLVSTVNVAIDEIVAQAGCELWYLPPYSPDLNLTIPLVVCAEELARAAVGEG